MNEVEKMYENAGVKKQIPKVCSSNELYCKECIAHIEDAMPYCKNAEYPPFTAEKQLEITKFIGLHYGFQMLKNEAFDYVIATRIYVKYEYEYKGYGYGYDVAIANLINNLWQDLTVQERTEIADILRG